MTISIPVVDIMHAEEHAAALSAPAPHYADVAAVLASGLIAASGRPHSVHEAVALWHSVHYALDGKHGQGTPHRTAWEAHGKPEEPHV